MHKGRIVVISIEKHGSSFIIEIQKGNSHFTAEDLLENTEIESKKSQATKISIPNLSDPFTNDEIADPEKLLDKKIMLIVEDNADVRSYIGSNFSEKFSILQAENGREGYKLACKHVPDIIISDVMMPEMDGIEFCNKIKNTVSTCHIPVILLTARSSITHKKEGYEIGADSYVTKPFSVDLLDSRVENLLKSRKQLKDYYTRSFLLQPSAISETPDDKFIKQLLGLIEKYIADPNFDISKLSSEMGMSRPVLYRKVKALTDLSIIEFIRTVRMNRAAQLLKTGQYRVSEVAFEVGFSDPKYFRKCFKEQFNINPSDLVRTKEADDMDES
jgi:YesN/AraC family two-component response regulator